MFHAGFSTYLDSSYAKIGGLTIFVWRGMQRLCKCQPCCAICGTRTLTDSCPAQSNICLSHAHTQLRPDSTPDPALERLDAAIQSLAVYCDAVIGPNSATSAVAVDLASPQGTRSISPPVRGPLALFTSPPSERSSEFPPSVAPQMGTISSDVRRPAAASAIPSPQGPWLQPPAPTLGPGIGSASPAASASSTGMPWTVCD